MFTFHVDPTHVMGLYPDLLPTDYRKQLQYPNPLPVLSGAELEKAHLALIDYLTQVGVIPKHREEFTWEFQYLLLYGRDGGGFCNTTDVPEVNTVEVWGGHIFSVSPPCLTVECTFC